MDDALLPMISPSAGPHRDPPGLAPGMVAIWAVRTDAIAAATEAALRDALSPAERVRADRFHFAADRTLYTAAHALLRAALAAHGVAAPVFRVNEWGKPALDGDAPLRFNLTHARGLAACALAWQTDVGIDAEPEDRVVDCLALAEAFFAPAEAAALAALPDPARQAAFLRIWTLKEAFIKAVGKGLSIPLADFAFTLEPFAFSCSPALGEDAEAWQFRSFACGAHRLGIALRHAGADAMRVHHRIITPAELASAVGNIVRK
jgi:4'-phosphopantetheinyl transferase